MEKKPVEGELGTQKRKLSTESDIDSTSNSSVTVENKPENEINKETTISTKNTTEVKKLKIPIKLSLSTTSAIKTDSTCKTDEKKDKNKSTDDLNNCLEKSDSQPSQIKKNLNPKVAQVFGDDEDEDEVEEMPFEAKMKMRNIGRNTPTSTGPNSYGKTNMGFVDQRKLFEKKLKEKADKLLHEDEN